MWSLHVYCYLIGEQSSCVWKVHALTRLILNCFVGVVWLETNIHRYRATFSMSYTYTHTHTHSKTVPVQWLHSILSVCCRQSHWLFYFHWTEDTSPGQGNQNNINSKKCLLSTCTYNMVIMSFKHFESNGGSQFHVAPIVNNPVLSQVCLMWYTMFIILCEKSDDWL